MSERKNIDRLFQEKFKDFEANPSENLWANIEAKLDEKKKRRILPFWWKLSGAAAIFLIGFLISKAIYSPNIKIENAVVNHTNSNKTNQNNTKQFPKKSLDFNNGEIKTHNRVADENSTVIEEKKSNGSKASNALIVGASNESKNSSIFKERNRNKKTVYSSKAVIAETNRSLKNKSNSDKIKKATTESVFEKSQNQVAQNTKNNSQFISKKEFVETSIETKTSFDIKNINLDGLKGNTNSKIVAQETEKKVNDTVSKNSIVSNALEELLNEKESKLKQESKRNRWQLTSNVAPIFLGSIGKGSPIDSTLSKNSKSFNKNVGYGIGISYAVNKKLSIRTGLNKTNMSYNTNDILFFTGIQAKTMKNVRTTASSKMIQIQSANANTSINSESGLLPFENSFTDKNSGYLQQEMGYLEMPVEMTYNLLDKRFGIKIIGGFSTLFLQDNSITIISENRDTLLGEANNLNNVHFSTNLGLGVKYGFMKSFEFNIEPTLKYQLNTFSSNSGNFKPYIFGVYSGVSYKF